MRNSYPKLIKNLLDDTDKHNLFYNIKQHTLFLIKIDKLISKILPLSLRPWYRIANFRQNMLILEVADFHWMVKLNCEKKNYYLNYVLKCCHH